MVVFPFFDFLASLLPLLHPLFVSFHLFLVLLHLIYFTNASNFSFLLFIFIFPSTSTLLFFTSSFRLLLLLLFPKFNRLICNETKEKKNLNGNKNKLIATISFHLFSKSISMFIANLFYRLHL